MPLRSLLCYAHRARRRLKRAAERKKNCRSKPPAFHSGQRLEILEPRLMLTVNTLNAVDDVYETEQDTAITVAILENDQPADEDSTLRISDFEQATAGSVFENENGTLTYSPEAGFHGEEQFTYSVTDESGRVDTATVTVDVIPRYYLTLVDFGATPASNLFGVGEWDVVIQDKYASHTAVGPGGLYQVGGSAVYNYQGITGPTRNFYEGEQIVATWYNSGETAITFTPQISLEDTNRRVSAPEYAWYGMESVTLEPGTSGNTTFTIDSTTSGDYGVVNVNSNAGSSSLIMDKIELAPVFVKTNLVDFGSQPSADLFDVSGWETIINDVYVRRTDAGPSGLYQYGGSAQYNFQGIAGTLKTFQPGEEILATYFNCLLYTSPSPRD